MALQNQPINFKNVRRSIKNQDHLLELSSALRKIIIDTVYFSGGGHYGGPLGFADVMTVLGFEFLNAYDKIVFSNGHVSVLLYSFYHLIDHPWYDIDQLKKFRKFGSNTPGHPEYNCTISTTTGPLGQGLGTAVGMAIAAKKNKSKHKIFCIVGDGCLMEGIAYEAISLAGHLRLDNLIVLFDSNSASIDGNTNLTISENKRQKFLSMNWRAIEVDGHDLKDIRKGFLFGLKVQNKEAKELEIFSSGCQENNLKSNNSNSKQNITEDKNESFDPKINEYKNCNKPTFIEFKTIIGKTSKLEGSSRSHHGMLKLEDLAYIQKNLNQINIATNVSNNNTNEENKSPCLSEKTAKTADKTCIITSEKAANKMYNTNSIKNNINSIVDINVIKDNLFKIDEKILSQWNNLNFLVDKQIIKDFIIYAKSHDTNSDKLKHYQSKYKLDENNLCPKSYHLYDIKSKDSIKKSNTNEIRQNEFCRNITHHKIIDKFTNSPPKIVIKQASYRYFNGRNTDDMLAEILHPIYIQYHNHPVSRSIFKLALEEILGSGICNIITGSADLTESNGLKLKQNIPITENNFSGNSIYYGAREHLMGAVCNGLALSGYIPICGTFLVFSDYIRPSIRLSALMKLKVIYIMTHDSVAVGEDGPTHQPIEQIASFRAMPNLILFRPYIVQELLLSIRYAMDYNGPSMICLPRQNLDFMELEINASATQNLSFYHLAGYLIAGNVNDNICIISTGSEVELSLKVRQLLLNIDSKNLSIKVVSVPSISILDSYLKSKKDDEKALKLFKMMSADYLFTIEAGSTLGLSGVNNNIKYKIFKQYGINEFGHSGSKEEIYKYFGFTPKDIAKDIIKTMM